MLAQVRHVLGHFRHLGISLCALVLAASAMALTHPRSGLHHFAEGALFAAAGLAAASVGIGLVRMYQCGSGLVTVTRTMDMSMAGPPLVQRNGDMYRITWIAPDNESHVAMTMGEDDVRVLADRLHQELYR